MCLSMKDDTDESTALNGINHRDLTQFLKHLRMIVLSYFPFSPQIIYDPGDFQNAGGKAVREKAVVKVMQ